MSNRVWLRLLALVTVLAVVAAACGSSGDDDDAADPGTDTETGTDDSDDADDEGTDGDTETTNTNQATIPPDEADPVAGGVLRYGVDADVDGINPTTSALAPSGLLMGNAVFDTLVAIDAERGWAPKLAESFTPNDDFSQWTMAIRPDITFHDGTPLDADAVIDNFNRQYNDALVGNALVPYYVEAEPITKVDDLTVRYNLKGQNAEWPSALTTQLGMMASPTWLAAAEADESLNQEPVGAGPFVFDSRNQDSVTSFVRNDDYYGGEVWLDGLEFFPITDGAQRADQLEGGAIDALMSTDSPSTQRLVEGADETGIQNVLDDSGEESFVMINSSVAPFDDIRVRQALTFATPRAAYNQRIADGINRLADQMFTPDSVYYNPDVVQEADAPDRAGPLIEEYCGEFPDNCTDGRVNMEYMYAGPSAQQSRIADLLTEGWSPFFNVSVQEVLQDDLILNAALGAYQVNTWRQFGATNPYNDRVWIGCETVGPISLNWPRFCDERRDDLIDEGSASTDEQVRIENMKEISVTLNEAYTYVFLNHSRWDNAFADNVRAVCDSETLEGVALECTSNARHYFEHIWMSS